MIKQISANELKEKLEHKESLILVDCREQNEWDQAHIKGAKLMPLSEFPEHAKKLDQNSQIIIQCRSGQRSMKACMYLEEQGFKNLTNLEGGILGWAQSGYAVVEPDQE